MFALEILHNKFISPRRLNYLVSLVVDKIPRGARVLDLGCGQGKMLLQIKQQRPDLILVGVDTHIPLTSVTAESLQKKELMIYDGVNLPFEDKSFDAVLVFDVLHHTKNPAAVLLEARRVSQGKIFLKDHLREGFLAQQILAFMDVVGNRRFGIDIVYCYLSRRQWHEIFDEVNLEPEYFSDDLRIYPKSIGWIFNRRLHFFVSLRERICEFQ